MTGATTDKHLTELIAKFYNISERNYNGKTYDNVLNIFDELDLEEQKRLLRGAIGLYAATASGLIHNKDLIDHGDANALLGYIKRLQEEKIKNIPIPAPAQAAPVVEVKKSTRSLLDKPTVLAAGSILGFMMMVIASAAASDNDDSMLRLILIKNFLEIVLSLSG